MYHVIGGTKSRAMRVLWALEEMGLPYTNAPEAPRSDAVRALNPSGKVPVLVTDEGAITDSTAILTYLADKHDMLTHPAGSYERARQDGLTQMVLDEFDAILWTAARHSFVLPPEHRLPAIKDSLRWEFDQSAGRLATAMQGPFLMGARMTIADIICAHCLNWAANAVFEVTQPALLTFRDMMRARPAFQKLTA